MKNKLLVLLALIVAVVAFWTFKNNANIKPPIIMEQPEIDSEATNIEAIQTNDKGETEYKLNADKMFHNTKLNVDEITGLKMDWTPSLDKHYKLVSSKATLDQNTGELQMAGGFKFIGSPSEPSSKITISGKELRGNTKDKTVYSDQPVNVTQGDNKFQAQSMTADLVTGDYVFTKIEVDYSPVIRTDKAVF